MFEQLIAAVANVWERLLPCTVVHVYQSAAILRFGHYNRTLEPGLHWKIPVVEEVLIEHTVMTTVRLQPQTCTTKDRRGVVVAGVVKYRLADIEPYIRGVFDQRDVLIDVAMGAILTAVRELTYDELVNTPPENKVATAIRRQVNKFGFEILAVTFTDIGLVRSLRIISHAVPAVPGFEP